ncbi:AAA ATPase domain-containing protein, partial [Streptomyces sp. DvalAA-14]|uniref:ATP-binding protein n=1 Tax=unclassified Streptomyces TaxID=2593676 RepID=UPI00081BA1F8
MKLIGRRTHLAAVEGLVERAAAGAGGHLIATGPAGAGKTALIDAAAELARERGLPVLRATGTDLDQGMRIWQGLLGELGDLGRDDDG